MFDLTTAQRMTSSNLTSETKECQSLMQCLRGKVGHEKERERETDNDTNNDNTSTTTTTYSHLALFTLLKETQVSSDLWLLEDEEKLLEGKNIMWKQFTTASLKAVRKKDLYYIPLFLLCKYS